MKKDRQIPFSTYKGKTRMMNYQMNSSDLRDDYEFEDTLKFISTGRGRSAVRFYMESTTEPMEYDMSLSEFENMLFKSDMVDQKVSGKWGFGKQGQNFTLKYLGK